MVISSQDQLTPNADNVWKYEKEEINHRCIRHDEILDVRIQTGQTRHYDTASEMSKLADDFT